MTAITGMPAVSRIRLQRPRDVEPVDVGHADVHEDDVGPVLARQPQCLLPARGGDHADAGALEQPRQDAAVDRAVVHDQRRQILARRQPRVERRFARRRPPSPGPPRVDIARPAPAAARSRTGCRCPTVLSTLSSSPIVAIRCWLMARPSPVPPAAAPSRVCVNASKIALERFGLDADAGVAHLEVQRVIRRRTRSTAAPRPGR